jgi:hypothetical protein
MSGGPRWRRPEHDNKLRELWPSDLKLYQMRPLLGNVSVGYISRRAKELNLPSRAARSSPVHPSNTNAIRVCVNNFMTLSKHPNVVRAAARRRTEPWQLLVRAMAMVAADDLFDGVLDDVDAVSPV